MIESKNSVGRKDVSLPLYVDDETVFERKGCDSCAYLEGYVSWWCTNEDAREFRGTGIPGVRHCDFWYPDYGRLEKSERDAMEAHGYSKPKSFVSKIFQKVIRKVWV